MSHMIEKVILNYYVIPDYLKLQNTLTFYTRTYEYMFIYKINMQHRFVKCIFAYCHGILDVLGFMTKIL